MKFFTANRSQQNLLGYSVEDFAKSDEKSHFVVETVSKLNLDELYNRYSNQGAEAYPPDMMLALWFYAYSECQTKTRQLEKLCHYDTRYIYISCNLRPDHTTLSRFRQNNLDLLEDYFLQIILMAEEEGIVDLKHISIDGTKMQASSSVSQSVKEDQLKRKIDALRKDIKHYMQRCNWVEQGSTDEVDLESLRQEKERLETLEKDLLERQRQLKERKQKLKPEHRKNHKINLVEPEARHMSTIKGPGYNAQIAVDNESKLIIANDTTDAPNDQNQFSSMHQKVEKNIPSDTKRTYTADSGYHSLDQLEYIEEQNIDATIADPTPQNRSKRSKPTSAATILKEKRKIERKDFAYHAQEDYYECPAGEKLSYVQNKGLSKIYRTTKTACGSCQLAPFCLSSKKRIKQLQRDKREPLAEKMSRKLLSDKSRFRMIRRAASVEPVFGNIKQNLGYRRFHLRGLKKVKGEFNLMCIAHNLNILFKTLQTRRLAAAIYALSIEINQHITISKIRVAIIARKMARFLMFPQKVGYVGIVC
jgi:transposase